MSTFERNLKGLLGTKLGMTQTWDENNRIVPVTVIAAGTNVVTQVRTPEKDGYNAIQIGFGEIDGRKVTKPSAGHFGKAGVTPRRHVAEIRTADAASYKVGQELGPELFAAGEEVDVTGTSKGKGYAGVMKLHGFHGVGASHGAHRNHRKPGSIGACATPGRVFKGMRMAGRMGSDTVTTQNVTVHAIDVEKGLILLKGAVPGPKGGLVVIRSAAKRQEASALMAVEDRQRRPPRGDLRRADQHPADPPGRGGPAGRCSPGHGVHQDPRRGPRRWPQALQAEGHRPRPSGLDPGAAVRRRWHRPRPAAAQLRPAHPQEDEGRRPAWRPLRPGPRRPYPRGRGAGRGPKPSTKAAVKAAHRPVRHRRQLVILEREDALTWLSLRNVAGAHILAVDQLNTYDVLLSDDVVFTKGAYDAFVGGSAPVSATRSGHLPPRPAPRSTPRTLTPRRRGE